MNIGIITTWFERGAAYVSRNYYEILSEENSVFIFARGGEKFGKDDPTWKDFPVTWTRSETVVIEKSIFEKWIKKNEIEIVLFNEQEHWWPPIIWAKELGLKTVGYVDYYKKKFINWFNIYDILLCNTKRHYSVFSWHDGAIYFPWGTNIDLFTPYLRKTNKNVIFFHSAGVGGINFRKGTDLLIKAFQDVQGPVKLIIHAQVELGHFGSEIANIVANDKRITFINETVSAPGLYHLGDVYVYPNRLDGLGLSVIEALSCGLPVICTDSAPCNENIITDYNGWLVAVKKREKRKDDYYWPETICDLTDLTNKMQYVVDNKNNIEEWKLNARRYAEEKLNWKINSRSLNQIFKTLYFSKPRKINYFTWWDIKNHYSKSPSIIWRIFKKTNKLLVILKRFPEKAGINPKI
jgi:glycosyltransferase involved in cell wall biosynthesis